MRKLKLLTSITIIMILVTSSGSAEAFETYKSYYYTRTGIPTEIETPYACQSVIMDFGGEFLKNPSDILVHGHKIYIVDTGNNRILVLDRNLMPVSQIKDFEINGAVDSLNAPQGIFISDDDLIYVADTNNGRIVVFDQKGNFLNVIKPSGQEFDKAEQPFVPTSLVIDKTGRLLVNSRQIYKGIVAMNITGEFIGYFGANKAKINPLEYFWKSIATREQRDSMVLDIPTEIAKIHLDREGFPYVINNSFSKAMTPEQVQEQMPVRRLNLTGDNILNFSDSDYYPIGDIHYGIDASNNRGASNIVDICTTDFGIYFLLDSSKGRIFAYNRTGANIFTFGNRSGMQLGTLRNPAALDIYEDSILVLDRFYGSVSVFKPTIFGKLILGALEMHYEGEYQKAGELWSQVRDGYGYYSMAYLGIGKVLLYERRYDEAMEYFEIARDREYYSQAFKNVRKSKVEENFVLIVLVLVLIVLVLRYGVKFAKKKIKEKYQTSKVYNEITHVFYTAVHPFKGFDEIKSDGKGSFSVSVVMFLMLAVIMFMKKTAVAFLFRTEGANVESLIKNVGTTFLVIFLWMGVLFLMEIFLEGEAKFSHVVHSTAIALLPAIVAHIIAIVFTYGASLDDGAMINTIIIFGWIWTGFLIFTGVLVINDYTMSRTIVASLVNLAGMVIVFMISVLFISLLQDMLIFLSFTLRELKGVFRL